MPNEQDAIQTAKCKPCKPERNGPSRLWNLIAAFQFPTAEIAVAAHQQFPVHIPTLI